MPDRRRIGDDDFGAEGRGRDLLQRRNGYPTLENTGHHLLMSVAALEVEECEYIIISQVFNFLVTFPHGEDPLTQTLSSFSHSTF